ncbi:MAG: ATP-binding cassette domain-containing protein [Nocardioides sp.]
MDEHALVAQAVVVHGPTRPLLEDITVTAHAGRMLAVTGSSGSGKTTLLSVLGGLLRPDQGEVSLAGQPPGNRHGAPRTGTALVLQTYGLVPTLTAEDNASAPPAGSNRFRSTPSTLRPWASSGWGLRGGAGDRLPGVPAHHAARPTLDPDEGRAWLGIGAGRRARAPFATLDAIR